jgi:hypothetical protein
MTFMQNYLALKRWEKVGVKNWAQLLINEKSTPGILRFKCSASMLLFLQLLVFALQFIFQSMLSKMFFYGAKCLKNLKYQINFKPQKSVTNDK